MGEASADAAMLVDAEGTDPIALTGAVPELLKEPGVT